MASAGRIWWLTGGSIVGAFLFPVTPAQSQEAVPSSAQSQEEASLTESQEAPSQEMSSPALAGILTRPLFEPTRRSKTEATAHRNDLPVVTGVVGDHHRWTAIFSGTPTSLGGLAAHSGEHFEDWTVKAVSPEEVTLERDGKALVIVPQSAPSKMHDQVGVDPGEH